MYIYVYIYMYIFIYTYECIYVYIRIHLLQPLKPYFTRHIRNLTLYRKLT